MKDAKFLTKEFFRDLECIFEYCVSLQSNFSGIWKVSLNAVFWKKDRDIQLDTLELTFSYFVKKI